jgi:predicted transcriptional regulator
MPAGEHEEKMVGLHIRVSPDLRRRLRIAAASDDRDIQQIVTDAVEEYLKARGS